MVEESEPSAVSDRGATVKGGNGYQGTGRADPNLRVSPEQLEHDAAWHRLNDEAAVVAAGLIGLTKDRAIVTAVRDPRFSFRDGDADEVLHENWVPGRITIFTQDGTVIRAEAG